MKTQELEKLYNECKNCECCELHNTRNNIVFSDGNADAKIVLIGEAPGENEDIAGKPFVGRAGTLLNDYLDQAGIDRQKDLFIINIVKCRPPKNRKPKICEKKECMHFLLKQINIVEPKLILLCGTTAMETFLTGKKITEVHGEIFDIKIEDKVYKALPILHPSPLCRIENKKRIMIEDLKKAKKLVI